MDKSSAAENPANLPMADLGCCARGGGQQ